MCPIHGVFYADKYREFFDGVQGFLWGGYGFFKQYDGWLYECAALHWLLSVGIWAAFS
jgi:hypothetical protein